MPSHQSDKTPRTADRAPGAIIMAAGQGTRMGGDRPKVAYEVAGRPMVWWVVDACRKVGVETCAVVIGYKGEQVKASLGDLANMCTFVDQPQQLGTGHAAMMAQPVFADQPVTDVFVLAGDGPLIRPRTLARLLEVHRRSRAGATLATAMLDDPTGYGRVLREADGGFKAIVEQKDATPEQLAIQEVNPSYYCFRSDLLFAGLSRLSNNNAQGEYYLTDVPALIKADGHTVKVVDAVPTEDVHSINTTEQLAKVDRILTQRLARTAGADDAA